MCNSRLLHLSNDNSIKIFLFFVDQQLSALVVLDVFQVLFAFHSPISLRMPLELFFFSFVNYA